jgi:uncharacterized heparinase superfamily protein
VALSVFSVERPLAAISRVLDVAITSFYATPFYRLSLAGRTPSRLARLPPPPWGGDVERGQAIVSGRLVCSGHSFDARDPDWFADNANWAGLSELHSFTWLDDLAALATPEAQACARALVSRWLSVAQQWHAVGWDSAVMGARLANCLTHARFLSTGDDDPLSRPLLEALARQTRHLRRAVADTDPGLNRLIALKGLIYADLCGFGDRIGARPLRALASAVAQQVLPDGGHIERSPGIHARALAMLLDVHGMLALASEPIPSWLTDAIGRMTSMLRFFRHGDGGLASFNDTAPAVPRFLDSVLARASRPEPIPRHAPQLGFARLDAGRTVVLIDVGAPAPNPFDRNAHAGTLSFEMSYGTERIIVNCGRHDDPAGSWRQAQRATAAHSTIVVDDVNSSEILPAGGIGRRRGTVELSLDSADDNVWLTASHDGYQNNLGIVVRRRLYLANDGRDLRGEDTLVGAHDGTYAIRFHLHPDIRASLVQSSAAILLRTPLDTAWRMHVAHAMPTIEESIYFYEPHGPRRTEQIVLNGRLTVPQTVIKWALRRIN